MVEYGITTSKAFIWAHVCPLDASIYWYRRDQMLQILAKYTVVEIKSARGHLVNLQKNFFPTGCIHDADLGYDFFSRWQWKAAVSDTEIGEWAEHCFAVAVRERRLTLPVSVARHDDINDQLCGKDFQCRCDYPVEVKADMPGGVWGTVNLFIQTHELHHQHGERNAHKVLQTLTRDRQPGSLGREPAGDREEAVDLPSGGLAPQAGGRVGQ